jgi:hypothetical protein
MNTNCVGGKVRAYEVNVTCSWGGWEIPDWCSARERRRAKHRASEYLIEDSKLWRVGHGKLARARAREEAVALARAGH